MSSGPIAPGPSEERGRRRSPLLIVAALFAGVLLGGSCVTCARLPMQPGANDKVVGGGGPRVAVIEVVDAIMDTTQVVNDVMEFSRREDIEALVVRIESPGGAVAPSQEVFDAMRAASERVPVVASMGTVAASGGFWIAMGADWVVAQPGSITGSIGVISQLPDLRGIADKVDFRVRTFKSGPVKDLGNPLRELTERDREVLQGLVDDIYDQFVTMVAERRGLDRAEVLPLADGQVMSGRRAFQVGLVDELGGLRAAARRAGALAQVRQGTQTSTSVALESMQDPSLVYPRGNTPEFLELLGVSLEEGIARGVSRALGAASGSAGVEVR